MSAKLEILSHFPKITLAVVEYQFDKKNMCRLGTIWCFIVFYKTLIINCNEDR